MSKKNFHYDKKALVEPSGTLAFQLISVYDEMPKEAIQSN
jgi:hypothetical protein